MNVFKSKIKEAVVSKANAVNDFMRFASKLARAMNLSTNEISDANDMGVEWDLGDYVISAHNRHVGNRGWNHVLEARPKEMPSDHGYSNVDHASPDPCDWYYKEGGTGTLIVPSENIQRDILKCIKEAINA